MAKKQREPQVYVDEYHDGKFFRSWDGVSECARAHFVAYDTIKCLIATGKPLYWEDDVDITFDTPASSPYTYDMVDMGEGRKVPTLIIDARKVLSNASHGKHGELGRRIGGKHG